MWWKKIVLLGLPMLLVLACGSDSDEPFTIGAMDALTGVAESYGNPLHQAKLLAVEEINAAGGINGPGVEAHRRGLQVRGPGRHHGLQQADRCGRCQN